MELKDRAFLFQSTLPARGATAERAEHRAERFISIHAPRTGSDAERFEIKADAEISIHAPRTGSDEPPDEGAFLRSISIHAPRTGSDCASARTRYRASYFNPRSPHGERLHNASQRGNLLEFQSTLPARGATVFFPTCGKLRRFQSTLPARGATVCCRYVRRLQWISIHAPRTGSDKMLAAFEKGFDISIHAPRTGSDLLGAYNTFYTARFQSTLPARGATTRLTRCFPMNTVFQSTLPARGATRRRAARRKPLRYFNPRSPHGERPRKVTILSIRIIDFAQKVYHKTVLLRISLAENAVILPEKPRNPVRTSLQKAGGLRFARAIRAAHPYSISSPSGA